MSIDTAYTGDFCFVCRADRFEITGVTGDILHDALCQTELKAITVLPGLR